MHSIAMDRIQLKVFATNTGYNSSAVAIAAAEVAYL